MRRIALAAAAAWALAGASTAAASETCDTSSPPGGAYEVRLCVDAPSGGLSGDVPVAASVTTTGADPGVRRVFFRLDGVHLLTDYDAPYEFTLPTDRFADGVKRLELFALMRDNVETPPTSVDLTFANGPSAPVVNTNTFSPSPGTAPDPGRPLVVAHVGDGVSGETTADDVRDAIGRWDPNLFLYSGDVYEKGTTTEFFNWGRQYFTPELRSITNPVIGNHEWENGQADGYFDFWDNIPHYYSYDAGGWHFIALDSTSEFGQTGEGSQQYTWLQDDLDASDADCTIAYFHHPLYNIGKEREAVRMQAIWRLLHDEGVDMVLVGHDHSYQRWEPLDADGQPAADGMTEFVVGTGGHGTEGFVRSDSRVEATSDAFGAQRLELNPKGATYRFSTTTDVTLDSGSVQCRGTGPDTEAPSTPTGLSASTRPLNQIVNLSWTAGTDDVGVVGYDIYRNGQLLTHAGMETTYTDTSVGAGIDYTYIVRARDEAGNQSAESDSAEVRTDDLAVLFFSGFELGNLSTWSMNRNLVAQTDEVFSGTWAARAQSTGAPTAPNFAYRIVGPHTELHAQTRFKIAGQGPTAVNLMTLKTASGKLLTLSRNTAGKLGYRNETTGNSVMSSKVVTLGDWHTVQVRLKVDGAAGASEVWFDGVRLDQLSLTDSFGATPIDRVEIGDSSTTKTYDMYFDEVIVDPSYIADTNDPSMPDRLTVTSDHGPQVRLEWNAGTDDVGVVGYDILRDGALLERTDNLATTYVDTAVEPNASYYYEVRARDGGENVSHTTSIATIDTPAVLGDDFESGNFTNWTSFSGMRDEQ